MFGRRVFAPSAILTLVTVALCALCIVLGRWQWQRGNARQMEWEQFSRGAGEVMALGRRALGDAPRFQRVSLTGRFDGEHQFLLDNRTHQGRAGFEVLTPLKRDGGTTALVDRGWVPFSGSRRQLPQVALSGADPGSMTVTGRVDELPAAGLASGRAAPALDGSWPKVTSYPTMRQLSAALGTPLEMHILLLDPGEPNGYVRDWHPPGIPPARNWSYAIQWWGFAVLTGIFWLVLSTRRTGASS